MHVRATSIEKIAKKADASEPIYQRVNIPTGSKDVTTEEQNAFPSEHNESYTCKEGGLVKIKKHKNNLYILKIQQFIVVVEYVLMVIPYIKETRNDNGNRYALDWVISQNKGNFSNKHIAEISNRI